MAEDAYAFCGSLILNRLGWETEDRPSVLHAPFLLTTLSEIVDGIVYDIPDPAGSGANPGDIGRELQYLILKGKGKILELAESLSSLPPAN